MSDPLRPYREVWCVGFEFGGPPGERPEPRCMVGREVRSGRTLRFWADELSAMPDPPFPIGNDSLLVAYRASAELGCFLALGWPSPRRVLDLFAEFRNLTNGLPVPCGDGLLGALVYFGLGGIRVAERDDLRQLALRGGRYSKDERRVLLDYCKTDVDALGSLLPMMLPQIDLPCALLRGRFMAAVAAMEWNGVPIDVATLEAFRKTWDRVRSRLVREMNRDYGVFVPAGVTSWRFSVAKFAEYLARVGIPWPRSASGALALDDDTFRQQSKIHPELAPLKELRHSLGEIRMFDGLAVGGDGRNRCWLSPFRSVTGRNQPSNAKFIFGPSCWLRSLIQPEPGRAVAYVDWGQQEFGIAAALSGDRGMIQAYWSGDPYLAFAKQVSAVPTDATKTSHRQEREQFKVCALAVQYGMGAESLACALGQPPAMARELLRLHRQTYPVFWTWAKAAVDHAMLLGWLQTVFGWRVHIRGKANPRSLANFRTPDIRLRIFERLVGPNRQLQA